MQRFGLHRIGYDGVDLEVANLIESARSHERYDVFVPYLHQSFHFVVVNFSGFLIGFRDGKSMYDHVPVPFSGIDSMPILSINYLFAKIQLFVIDSPFAQQKSAVFVDPVVLFGVLDDFMKDVMMPEKKQKY